MMAIHHIIRMGSISQAWSVGEVLRSMKLIRKYGKLIELDHFRICKLIYYEHKSIDVWVGISTAYCRGLGTASYGLTKGLAKHGVKVMSVMPKAGGDEDQSVVKIINASDVEMMSEYSNLDEYWQNVNFMEIGSNLVPYLDPETFERTVRRPSRRANIPSISFSVTSSNFPVNTEQT